MIEIMSQYPGIMENMYYFTKTFLAKFEDKLESSTLKKTYKKLWVGVIIKQACVSINLQVFSADFYNGLYFLQYMLHKKLVLDAVVRNHSSSDLRCLL